MGKLFVEYLGPLLKMSGIKEDDPKVIELKEKLGDFSLDDEQQTLLNNNILTRESAKNNTEIRKHYLAETLDYVDKDHKSIMDKAGFSEEEKQELLKLKTGERTNALYERIERKYKKQLDELPKGAGKEEIAKLNETYQKQLDELSGSLKAKEGELTQLKEAHENELIGLSKNNFLASLDYTDKYDKADALDLARLKLERALEENGVQLVRGDDNKISLKKDGLDFMVNNEKATLDSFGKSILSENKLLKAADKPQYPNQVRAEVKIDENIKAQMLADLPVPE